MDTTQEKVSFVYYTRYGGESSFNYLVLCFEF